MQYILSQREYDELTEGREGTRVYLTKNQLQKLCTNIADTMPVQWGWSKKTDPDDYKPWGCVITVEKTEKEKGFEGYEWYCDKCPVQDICPSERKPYSK